MGCDVWIAEGVGDTFRDEDWVGGCEGEEGFEILRAGEGLLVRDDL